MTTPSPAAAVLRTEARLFTREPGSLFWVMLSPTVLLVILGLIPSFREASEDLGGRRVIDLYVPVSVLFALIMSGLQAMPPVLAGYRERGILRRMSTTPVRPGALLTAQIALHAAAALVSSTLAVTVGRIAFGVALPGNPAGYVLALLLAVASGLALGSAVCAVSRSQKIATAVGSAVFFPTMFTAGVWVPVQAMPDTLQRIVGLTPFGAASKALDAAASGDWPGWAALGVMALWTAVLTGASVRWFRWE
ncbi:ABC transporter permease [Streptomyces sp. NBC_00233]|uniref:ABC transporter permease n=1 Tax=Streptomyces sp. NBC_00233 TaxID=2975686 RepID=UPI002256D029|nr:ABC transporter permease [Streptomyces sp. NBC_00233]MCX5228781.1 ABC transporter permease [Streptomyces sp. NBC_00233]